MSWNGLGTYNLPPAFSPEVNGTVIDAVRYNGLTTDVAAGITACLNKSGENVPTNNIPWGGFLITGLGAAASLGDALSWGRAASVTTLAASGAATFASTVGITGVLTLSAGMVMAGTLTGITNLSMNGVLGTPSSLVMAGAISGVTDLTTTGNTILGNAVGDTLNVAGNSINVLAGGGVMMGGTALGFGSAGRQNLEINGASEALYGLQTAGVPAGYLYHNGTNLSLTNVKNGSFNLGTNNQAVITLTTSGQTLIGPTGPSSGSASGLEVVGASNSIVVRGGSSVGYQGLRLYNDQNSSVRALEIDYTGSAWPGVALAGNAPTGEQATFATTGAYPMTFGTNNTARLGISAAGLLTECATGFVLGYKDMPKTIVSLSQGMCFVTSAGFSITTGFPDGWTASCYNDSGSAITITQGPGMTLRLAGTTTTGNRTIAARGFATFWFNNGGECILMGPGVS